MTFHYDSFLSACWSAEADPFPFGAASPPMLAYLYGVVAAGAVNQKLAVDVYGNMMYLHPAFAPAAAATPTVGAIALTAACILTGEKDKVACLKLACVGKQYAHIAALLRHARGGQAVYGG